MKFEWTEAMSTGIEEIDNEHRTLFAWINRLSEANATGTGEHEVMRVLSFLGIYASKHFAHEEDCFARHVCPHAELNRKAHREFVTHFAHVKAECEAHGVTETKALELQEWLGQWLQNHILRVDSTIWPFVP